VVEEVIIVAYKELQMVVQVVAHLFKVLHHILVQVIVKPTLLLRHQYLHRVILVVVDQLMQHTLDSLVEEEVLVV
jgi:hypothetical protein